MIRHYEQRISFDKYDKISVEGTEEAIKAFEADMYLYKKARELYQSIYTLANDAEVVKNIADSHAPKLRDLLEEV